MSALLVLTREEHRDQALRASAEGLGFRTLALPLLATEPGRDRARFEARVGGEIGPDTAIAWTSRRAGEAFAAMAAAPATRARIARVPLFAVGAESAAPAREAGFGVETPEDDAGATALAAHMIGRRGRLGFDRALFLHGDRALPDLPDALRRAGIEVEPYEVYRTRFLAADAGPLEDALSTGAPVAVACFSPSGIEALERLLSPGAVQRLRSEGLALARGATTRAALESRGYRRAVALRPGARHDPKGNAGPSAFDSAALQALQSMARVGPRMNP